MISAIRYLIDIDTVTGENEILLRYEFAGPNMLQNHEPREIHNSIAEWKKSRFFII